MSSMPSSASLSCRVAAMPTLDTTPSENTRQYRLVSETPFHSIHHNSHHTQLVAAREHDHSFDPLLCCYCKGVRAHTLTHARTHTYTHFLLHTHRQIRTHARTHARAHTYIHTHTHYRETKGERERDRGAGREKEKRQSDRLTD